MYAEDAFPLFFLRVLHHTCCFFYHAPTILWILFYVEYYAVSIRLDEQNRPLLLITFWLSFFVDQLTRYFRVTATIPLGFGRFLEQTDIFTFFFLLCSPLNIQSLLPCLDTVTSRFVSTEKRDKILSVLFAWVSYLSGQQTNPNLQETKFPPTRTGTSSDPSYPPLAYQPIQLARHPNEVQPRSPTRPSAVGAYPTGSVTDESELPTTAIENGASMRAQPTLPAVSEDELSDELPPSIEWVLNEATGEIIPRFKEDEVVQTQERTTAEGSTDAPLISPTECDHEPIKTRYGLGEAVAVSGVRSNRQGQKAASGTKLVSVEIRCPRCHFIFEKLVEHPDSDRSNAMENNTTHPNTDDTPMGDDDVFVAPQTQTLGYQANQRGTSPMTEVTTATTPIAPVPVVPEDRRRRIGLEFDGEEVMEDTLDVSVNSWMEQIPDLAELELAQSVCQSAAMGSPTRSTSDIDMGSVNNPSETMQDGSWEPQPTLHSERMLAPLDVEGLPGYFNLPSGSKFFSPAPSPLTVDTRANIGALSSAISVTSPTHVGLVYSDGAVEALLSDVSIGPSPDAPSTRARQLQNRYLQTVSSLRRVPQVVTPSPGGTTPSLKRSRSEDGHFMREAESPLGAKRCRRETPEQESIPGNGRQRGQRRRTSAARRLLVKRPSLRDLQTRIGPIQAEVEVETGHPPDTQVVNEVVMQEEIGAHGSPLSDLESYTSPVLEAVKTGSLPDAEVEAETILQEEGGVQREPIRDMQSDVTRILAEINSDYVLNMPAGTEVVQEEMGVQGSPLSDLESYESPVLAAVETGSLIPDSEVEADIVLQEQGRVQREPIHGMQSDIARILAEIDSEYVLNIPAGTEFVIREDEGVRSDPLRDLQSHTGQVLAEIETASLPDTKMEAEISMQEKLAVDSDMADREADSTNTMQRAAVLEKGKGKEAANLEAEPERETPAELNLRELARQADPKDWKKFTRGGIPRASQARRMGAAKPLRASPKPVPTQPSTPTQTPPVSSSPASAAAEGSSSSTVVATPGPMARMLAARHASAGRKVPSSSGVRKPGVWGKLADAMKTRKPSMQQKRREAERVAAESEAGTAPEPEENPENNGDPSGATLT